MLRLIPILLILAATASAGSAQSVEDLYHGAARTYVDGNNPEAEELARRGLEREPDHIRLQRLLALIQEQRDPSAGAAGADGEAGPAGAPPPEQQDDGEEPPQNGEDENGEDGESQDGDDQDQGDDGGAGGDQMHDAPGDGTPMSRDEAERILRAIEADEQETMREAQRRRTPTRPMDKDW